MKQAEASKVSKVQKGPLYIATNVINLMFNVGVFLELTIYLQQSNPILYLTRLHISDLD